MSVPVIQSSFAAGELSPQLMARVDLDKFHIGLAETKNVYVDYRGGVASRPGTRLVGKTGSQDLTQSVRLIRFQFSIAQSYVLELGHRYMRVIRDAGYVLSGGAPYQLLTPWAWFDLALLKFSQSNDVITVTHPDYQPFEISRLAEANWSVDALTFRPTVRRPMISEIIATSHPAEDADPPLTMNSIYDYVVTQVGEDGTESLPSDHKYVKTYPFERVQQSIAVKIKPNGQDAVYFNVYKATQSAEDDDSDRPASAPTYGYIGTTRGRSFVDSNILPDFAKTPPTYANPFAPGGVLSIEVVQEGDNYAPGTKLTVTDPTGGGAVLVPIFDGKKIVAVQVLDSGLNYTNPDIAISNEGIGNGFAANVKLRRRTGIFPGVNTYFQQRRVFAASHLAPSTYWTTRPGQFENFMTSVPPKDDDATTFSLAALEQNPIKYMIPMQNGLVMLTGGAAWLVTGGGENSGFGPNSVRQTLQVYNGTADVPPLVIGYNILYVQEKGYSIQDLKYDFLSSIYTGEDRTYLATHLFENDRIKEWCYAEQPARLIWVVMQSGKLLTMTYLPEQKVYGWARHETNGLVESIVACPEAKDDVVYIVVRRPTGRFVERLETRRGWTTQTEAWCLDCALRYSGDPVTLVGGLGDLVGERLDVVADGKHVGTRLVSNSGHITLAQPASTVLAGYAFDTSIRTMYLDTKAAPTVQGKRKLLDAAMLRVVGSRGLKAGRVGNGLDPVKEQDFPADGSLISADLRINLNGSWETNGQVGVQGSPGMPWALTALSPEVSIGDSDGR